MSTTIADSAGTSSIAFLSGQLQEITWACTQISATETSSKQLRTDSVEQLVSGLLDIGSWS